MASQVSVVGRIAEVSCQWQVHISGLQF